MSYKYPHHSKAVLEFTEARLGSLPQHPKPLSELAVRKYVGLCISELRELARTVTSSNEDAQKLILECSGMDPAKKEYTFDTEEALIAAQADAMVDLEYYSRDIAGEHGIDLDLVFDEVHDANMRKKFPDGTFHTQEIAEGIRKVIKPPGWVEPDIEKVIRNMSLE